MTHQELIQDRIEELEKQIKDCQLQLVLLEENEKKLRTMLDNSFQFIGLLGAEGEVLKVNRAALDFCRIEADSVLGRPFWETVWWSHSPELQNLLQRAVGQAASGGFVRFEASHMRWDGIEELSHKIRETLEKGFPSTG